MIRYIAGRFVSSVVALWVIVTVTFILMHSIPGGPFTREKKLPPAIIKNLEAVYNLDDPLPKQYADYLARMVKGDLGPSFKYENRTVNDIIADGFPVSAILGLLSVAFSLAVGLPLGILAALRQGQWQDWLAMFLATIGIAVPSFVLAPALMFVFALKLGWLPPAMWGKPSQVILPMIALSGFSIAFFVRIMRSGMIEVLSQDFIKTARAKGLPGILVIYRHAVKNALIPVVTYLGPLLAGILTGSFIIEHYFAIPGLGRWFVTSIQNRDYTVILGLTVFYSALLLVMNFLVDVAYVLVDPRIKIIKTKEG